ncbi:MAG: hypothetical protein DYH13_03345 [Alphaproteobacteria bacterium PRO2]|nr:hypothetical protein [Alphaproteobacteria bacterium PRO2]
MIDDDEKSPLHLPRTKRFEKELAALRLAAINDNKPIVLKLSFSVDSDRKTEGLTRNPKQYHLVTLKSAGEYVAVRQYLGSMLHDARLNLDERLEVSYRYDRIPHKQFAMDEQSPARLVALYNELSAHPARVLRFINFSRTNAMVDARSHWKRRHLVDGYVGIAGASGRTRKILLEEAGIYERREKVEKLREILVSPKSVYVIGYLCVNLNDARSVEKQFQNAAGADRIVWAKLLLDVHWRSQLAEGFGPRYQLPGPAGSKPDSIIPVAPPREESDGGDKPRQMSLSL